MRIWKMILAIILVSVLLLGAISLAFKERILMAVGDYLVIQDVLQPADVIHVIAGEDYRLDYAIQLYQQGYGKKIFLTGGGWCPIHKVIHGEGWKKRALERGVTLEDIVIDDFVITSTYSETVQLKTWIDQSSLPIRSVIVVSDPFHMLRARWTNRRVLGKGAEIIMAPVPLEQTPFQQRWWEDWRSTHYVIEEYKKFIYYIARYQWSWGPITQWLTSLDDE